MIEVFVFGVFVAYVKLGDLVHITLDTGVYALFALTFVMIWADGALDRQAVWERLDRCRVASGGSAPRVEASRSGSDRLRGLRLGQRHRARRSAAARAAIQPLHARKPDSMARTWALVIAAAILYVPAN